ncbi:PQ loop repeat protein [bacterium BMS3Abin10]|nr:PQ loop repeat protein [bacterium BMS3Abin10]GBE38939.1 PQ loop repeat protein [bacterium BMS3Bbin08]
MMDINYITIIGLLAGTCTIISFLPQVIKTAKTKKTKDISLAMYAVLAVGLFMWVIYGVLLNSYPIILANSVSFILAVTILVLKIRYG